MCRRPKPGKLVSVRAAICRPSSTSPLFCGSPGLLAVKVASKSVAAQRCVCLLGVFVCLHRGSDTKGFLSSLQPDVVQSLVMRLETFGCATEQRSNAVK
jgi:hypothetical protein